VLDQHAWLTRAIDSVEMSFCLQSRLQARGKCACQMASDNLRAIGKRRAILLFNVILAKEN